MIPGHYDPGAERQLGSPQGRAEVRTLEAETAAKAWAQFASTAGPPRPALSRRLRSRNPSLPACPGNGITVFNPGEAMPNALIETESN